jgi:ABC-2 type transport system permease protein
MFAVLKREFRSYFQNVIGWLFVAALMALFGLYFYVYNLRQGYVRRIQGAFDLPFGQGIVR